MPTPDENRVKAILDDFHSRLRRVVDDAWAEWLEFPRAKLVFLARARAVLVFDYIVRRALAEFEGDPNIRTVVKKQTIQFLFKDRVLLRFKKGNAKGVGSNIRTQAVLDFIDPNREIPGLVPEIMKVELCYTLDDLGINLDEVEVVARDQTSRRWAYPLEPGAPSAVIMPLPQRPPDTTPPAVLPRQRTPAEQTDRKK